MFWAEILLVGCARLIEQVRQKIFFSFQKLYFFGSIRKVIVKASHVYEKLIYKLNLVKFKAT